jgi:hypothetical protein
MSVFKCKFLWTWKMELQSMWNRLHMDHMLGYYGPKIVDYGILIKTQLCWKVVMTLFQKCALSCNFMHQQVIVNGIHTITLKNESMAMYPAHFGCWDILDFGYGVYLGSQCSYLRWWSLSKERGCNENNLITYRCLSKTLHITTWVLPVNMESKN